MNNYNSCSEARRPFAHVVFVPFLFSIPLTVWQDYNDPSLRLKRLCCNAVGWHSRARQGEAVTEGVAPLKGVPSRVKAPSVDFTSRLTFPGVCPGFHHDSVQTSGSN